MAMMCPYCGNENTKVISTIAVTKTMVKRRRKCPKCRERFNTFEEVDMEEVKERKNRA